MIAEKTLDKISEEKHSEYEDFIKRFNLEGTISSQRPQSKSVKETPMGNCCGTCTHCPLA